MKMLKELPLTPGSGVDEWKILSPFLILVSKQHNIDILIAQEPLLNHEHI